MEQKRLKTGIIGCGGIANKKHMHAIKTADMSDMVAFCDLIPERAEKAAREYGVPGAKVYTDYKELLADPEIDVVHVCTPNRSHAQISIDAMYAGKHVMCEKPMAKSAEDARRMVAVAKETGKKLTIGYQHRHKVAAQYAKAAIDRGDLGEMYYAEATATRRRGTPTWGVFLNEYEQGGGPLIDIGTHSLDLTLYLMNNYKPKMVVGTTYKKLTDPNQANPFGPWDPKEHTMEDSAFGFIVMENGATIILRSSWALNTAQPISSGSTMIAGSKAGVSILNNDLLINKDEFGRLVDIHPDITTGVDKDNSSVNEARSWYSAILNDTDPVVLPEQACVVSEILEAIYISAKTGEPYFFNK